MDEQCEEAVDLLAAQLEEAVQLAKDAEAKLLVWAEFAGSKTWGHME